MFVLIRAVTDAKYELKRMKDEVWCVFTLVFTGKGTRLRKATARQANSESVAAGKKLAEEAAKF